MPIVRTRTYICKECGCPWLKSQGGAGRKAAVFKDAGLLDALDRLVDPATRGDPESPLRWTSKSTQRLAEDLTRQGHRVSARTVAKLLDQMDYSLQANRKVREGSKHPDRNQQFEHISEQVQQFQRRGQPVISVDTKKKENVGPFCNAGVEWHPKQSPEQVNDHDFPDPKKGKAIPYGVYDIRAKEGWVNVGTDHDTPESGRERHPTCRQKDDICLQFSWG